MLSFVFSLNFIYKQTGFWLSREGEGFEIGENGKMGRKCVYTILKEGWEGKGREGFGNGDRGVEKRVEY